MLDMLDNHKHFDVTQEKIEYIPEPEHICHNNKSGTRTDENAIIIRACTSIAVFVLDIVHVGYVSTSREHGWMREGRPLGQSHMVNIMMMFRWLSHRQFQFNINKIVHCDFVLFVMCIYIHKDADKCGWLMLMLMTRNCMYNVHTQYRYQIKLLFIPFNME